VKDLREALSFIKGLSAQDNNHIVFLLKTKSVKGKGVFGAEGTKGAFFFTAMRRMS